jgi:SNF2 family DNA or RNA helicase
MNLLESYLKSSPAVGSVLMYHGGMNEVQKAESLKMTEANLGEKHQILLLQLQSGGVGLNLQHFSKIVFMSPWWTAAMMDQAIGRAVRIGQEKTVEVTMLVLKEEETMNIDLAMLEKAEGKRTVLERLFENASRGLDNRPRLRIRIPENKAMEDEINQEILEEMNELTLSP